MNLVPLDSMSILRGGVVVEGATLAGGVAEEVDRYMCLQTQIIVSVINYFDPKEHFWWIEYCTCTP